MPKKLEPDWRILFCAVALVLVGMVMIFSASGTVAGTRYGDPAYFLKRQMIWALIGFAGMAVAMRINYRKLADLAPYLYLLSLILLFMVLIPGIGKEVSGARRWIAVGGFTFQPSEFAKLALIIAFSHFLVKKESAGRLKDFVTGYMPNAIALGICFVLILLQPDMGTSLIASLVVFTLFFVSGIRFRYILGTFLMLLPFLYIAVLNVDYRRRRILSFLDPWADPSDTGFQIIQSYVALGNGHIFGAGLGQGKQKNFFLPDAHTDFIFSIIGEEFGFLGCALIVLLFIIFVYLGFRAAMKAPDPFGMYLATGITASIGMQAVVNFGVATGLLPTKGLPLPFISLGGSALVMWLISVGILLNVSQYKT
ncbi:MAG: putative lipid II flippase FtsW [Nitrospinae bacterium]|nr:putative lipid II flippase FtsW [Nitrospinota bacterium]